MLQYVIFSLQHRDIDFTHICFVLFCFYIPFHDSRPLSDTDMIRGTALFGNLYNKYTVHRWGGVVGEAGVGLCPVWVVKWQRVFTRKKSAPKLWVGPPIAPSQSRALRSTSAPLPLRSPRLHLSVAREVRGVGRRGGRHPLWAMCPALWIHLDDNHKKRKTINDINNYYYNKKITSLTDNLPRSTSQKWKKLKLKLKTKNKNKKKVCVSELSSGLESTTMEGWRIRCDQQEQGTPRFFFGQRVTSSVSTRPGVGFFFFVSSVCPVFLFFKNLLSLSVPCEPPSVLVAFFFSLSLARCVSRVSGPGRSCSTSAWSTHGCRTWTSGPAGSTPPCLHLCILETERRETC